MADFVEVITGILKSINAVSDQPMTPELLREYKPAADTTLLYFDNAGAFVRLYSKELEPFMTKLRAWRTENFVKHIPAYYVLPELDNTRIVVNCENRADALDVQSIVCDLFEITSCNINSIIHQVSAVDNGPLMRMSAWEKYNRLKMRLEHRADALYRRVHYPTTLVINDARYILMGIM